MKRARSHLTTKSHQTTPPPPAPHHSKPAIRTWQAYATGLVFTWAFALALPLLDYVRQDVTIAYPQRLWLPINLHIIIAWLLFSLFFWTLRTNAGRLFAAIVAVFVLMQHFPKLSSILKPLTFSSGHTLASLIVTVIFLGALWLVTYLGERLLRQKQWQDGAVVVLRFVCLAVLLYNGYLFVRAYHHNAPTANYQLPKDFPGLSLHSSNHDIYYLVFDDYSGNQALKNYLHYDNSAVTSWLQDQGFVVPAAVYSNYQDSASSIASTMRLNYLGDVGQSLHQYNVNSHLPYERTIRNAPIDDLVKQAGYNTYMFGGWWNPTRWQVNATSINPDFTATFFNHTGIMSELQSDALNRTFLWPLMLHGVRLGPWTLLGAHDADPRTLFLNQVQRLQSFATAPHSQPRFVFAHFLNPHEPYVFTATGGVANGADTEAAYVDQVRYVNTVMMQLVASIKRGAKDPIIIIQSDEGRPIDAGVSWQNANPDTLRYKFNTFAAYLLPGLDPAQSTQLNSPVNVFRFVLNNYLGGHLAYLPDCSFVYNLNDYPFQFYDITHQLHTSSSNCQQYVR